MVAEFGGRAIGLLPEVCPEEALSIAVIGQSLIVNDTPLPERGMHIESFMRRMKKKGIDRVVFRAGLEKDELARFVEAVASRDSLSSSPHIAVGIVEVKFAAEGPEAATLLQEASLKVGEALEGVSRFRRLDMVGLEEAVVSFVAAIKRQGKVLRIVSPVKTHNQYTYVHATNVSVLTIFQAESLKVTGEDLHDIGLAGLLHDVGKMFVAAGILDKPGKLDAGEWAEIQSHPRRGAVYLSKLADVPPLASIVAFEHHIKFNGGGYPDSRRIARTPHIVSQMVAISDFFDALRTARSYRRPMDVASIARLLREGAQRRDFNPVLVDSFLSSLSQITGVI